MKQVRKIRGKEKRATTISERKALEKAQKKRHH